MKQIRVAGVITVLIALLFSAANVFADATGHRLVDVLEPVGADDHARRHRGVHEARIGLAPLVLASDGGDAVAERSAIGRTEMKLRDQHGLVGAGEFARLCGHRRLRGASVPAAG